MGESGLPPQLLALRDPASPVALPPPTALPPSCLPLDNWKLDKLVLSLSANAATWRRALLLFEWLKAAGHQLDDRLCTTVGLASIAAAAPAFAAPACSTC